MNKKEVKKILMSMRTAGNEEQVNNLLGKIDTIDEDKLQVMINQIGNDEDSIKRYFEEKLSERRDEHTPINNMFTYGISGNTIHLQKRELFLMKQRMRRSEIGGKIDE